MTGVVGFVGLGVMGRPMAVNLQRAGFKVTAYTRSEASRARARDAGLTVVDELRALPDAPDFVVTVLPDSPDVERVLLAEDGLSGHVRQGTLFVDMSTIAPDAAQSISAALVAAGHRFIDAPVSGGESGAIDALLSIMIGGLEADVAEANSLFKALGKTIVHIGPHGAGQTTKAANQMIVAGNLAVLGEALVFIENQGIDPRLALLVIGGGLAGSTVLERKASAMVQREFAPGFRLALHAKDLGIVERASADGPRLPVNALVTELVRALVNGGRGELDHSALYLSARNLVDAERA